MRPKRKQIGLPKARSRQQVEAEAEKHPREEHQPRQAKEAIKIRSQLEEDGLELRRH